MRRARCSLYSISLGRGPSLSLLWGLRGHQLSYAGHSPTRETKVWGHGNPPPSVLTYPYTSTCPGAVRPSIGMTGQLLPYSTFRYYYYFSAGTPRMTSLLRRPMANGRSLACRPSRIATRIESKTCISIE